MTIYEIKRKVDSAVFDGSTIEKTLNKIVDHNRKNADYESDIESIKEFDDSCLKKIYNKQEIEEIDNFLYEKMDSAQREDEAELESWEVTDY